MLDSIHVGMSGLLGFSSGLRVAANNTANLSTAGFKGSRPQFSDQLNIGTVDAGMPKPGSGLVTHSSVLDWRQGELRPTGNALDLAVDGLGLFMLRDASGAIYYTRAGQFEFNDDDVLVNRIDGHKVLMVDAGGQPGEVSLAGLHSSPPQVTSLIGFNGNLSSTGFDQTITAIPVIDHAGGTHRLTLVATSIVSPATGIIDGNTWSLALSDAAGNNAAAVGGNLLTFTDGKADAASARIRMNYTPAGQGVVELTLDFSGDVSAFASGTFSSLALGPVDGTPAGALTRVGFDANGSLTLHYSNGATAQGGRLALGRFESQDSVRAVGNNQFEAVGVRAWQHGMAGEGAFGAVRSSVIEISNVDLSGEFSNLVIMQRGYQGSSQIISTANEMLQELFNMGGK